MKRTALLVVVLAAAALSLGAGDGSRFDKLGHKLMCRCGACGEILLECNHAGCAYSDGARKELAARIQKGESDDQILAWFVEQYGETVLAAPPTSGFNWVAWIGPLVAFAVGIVLAVIVIGRWKKRPKPPSGPAAPNAKLEEFRSRARQETEL